MGLIGWLVSAGFCAIGAAAGLWGLTEISKTVVIWGVGVPGAFCLVIAAGFEFQNLVPSAAVPEKISEATIQQLRANVMVDNAEVSYSSGEKPTMVVSIKNAGQTPARNLTWRAKFILAKPDADDAQFTLDPNAAGVPIDLPPGNFLSYKYTFDNWRPEFDAFLERHEVYIYAVGEIRYLDAFGNRRATDYRLRSSGRFSDPIGISPGKFGPAPGGNKSN